MSFRKVTAIVRSELLEQVEARLVDAGVEGLTVVPVKGYGEYANLFSHDWMVRHAQVEIFAAREKVPEIVGAIMAAARTGSPGDGIVAVQPVEHLYRVREENPVVEV